MPQQMAYGMPQQQYPMQSQPAYGQAYARGGYPQQMPAYGAAPAQGTSLSL